MCIAIFAFAMFMGVIVTLTPQKERTERKALRNRFVWRLSWGHTTWFVIVSDDESVWGFLDFYWSHQTLPRLFRPIEFLWFAYGPALQDKDTRVAVLI